jgi:hypothetical protein
MKTFITAVITACLAAAIILGVGYFIFQARVSQLETTINELANRPGNGANLPPLSGNTNGTTDNTNQLATPGNMNQPITPGNTNQPITPTDTNQPQNPTGDILDHAVFVTSSTDPTNFPDVAEPTFLKGSVPEILVLTQDCAAGNAGDVLMYFPSFETFTGPGGEQLVMAKSTDSGKTWSARQSVTFTNKVNSGAAVDPSAVQLDDGTIRLYYYGPSAPIGSVPSDPANEQGEHSFYSAVSDDGINFTGDAGVRFAKSKVTDPDVIYHQGRWLMYYSLGQTSGIASSADGLAFEDTELSWNGGGVPGAYVDPANYVHLYGCSKGGIQTASSIDGVTFTDEPEIALSTTEVTTICDPSPARLDDGTILMTYKKVLQSDTEE